MILKPHEILKQLGFDVPEAGVGINFNDAYLTRSALALVGGTMDVSRITTSDLSSLNVGLSGVAPSRDLPAPRDDDESLERLKLTVALVARRVLKPCV
ncbi:hypothetical protein [Massilia sp. CCM 8734]|uniref:hypothetical protein n=1 Tax=Massilia sp. CCM 8734 TaxID=2609283 RepID=UPI001422D45B|nr:hypothetical protein [Massilia sp. CCM 8734]NHZ99091.1 hypothetical protein [Massilia sp. CCM 8734]